ncbi:hypothetical protein [Nevskia sp.]|uniref:hypothetical protein n=1 Tax=Nevskia sp. TaxID=1929292 RepID=UPI0025FDDC86|nr:hypothetical protein [Nevskia sp.]
MSDPNPNTSSTEGEQKPGGEGAAPPPPPAAPKAPKKPPATSTAVQVRCMIENCGDEVNGVKFTLVRDPKGKVAPYMLSEEITQEQADAFLAIPGYVFHE